MYIIVFLMHYLVLIFQLLKTVINKIMPYHSFPNLQYSFHWRNSRDNLFSKMNCEMHDIQKVLNSFNSVYCIKT